MDSKFTLSKCPLCSNNILTFFGELPSGYAVHNGSYTGTIIYHSSQKEGSLSTVLYRQGVFNPVYKKVICEDCDNPDSFERFKNIFH